MKINLVETTNRNLQIDILKCLLIISVVIGHALPHSSVRYIFWFHMPVFFMISGVFLKDYPDMTKELKKKVIRLVVPYITFSLFLGLLARHGDILKTGAYTLFGGFANTTEYTGPYYFINALFFAILLYYIGEVVICKHKRLNLHRNRYMACYCIALYLLAQLLNALLPFTVFQYTPWAIDDAFYVVIYLYIGKRVYQSLPRLGGVTAWL